MTDSNYNCAQCGNKLDIYEYNQKEIGIVCDSCMSGKKPTKKIDSLISELRNAVVEYENTWSQGFQLLTLIVTIITIGIGVTLFFTGTPFLNAFLIPIFTIIFLLLIFRTEKFTVYEKQVRFGNTLFEKQEIDHIEIGFSGKLKHARRTAVFLY